MKDMKFPLDMIWIYQDTIIDISQNVPVPTAGQNILTLPQFQPKSPVDKVLEIDAGLSAKYGFKIGDKVITRLPVGEKAKN
jgi:uncharacterized membrane protein (UPF0127 family)